MIVAETTVCLVLREDLSKGSQQRHWMQTCSHTSYVQLFQDTITARIGKSHLHLKFAASQWESSGLEDGLGSGESNGLELFPMAPWSFVTVLGLVRWLWKSLGTLICTGPLVKAACRDFAELQGHLGLVKLRESGSAKPPKTYQDYRGIIKNWQWFSCKSSWGGCGTPELTGQITQLGWNFNGNMGWHLKYFEMSMRRVTSCDFDSDRFGPGFLERIGHVLSFRSGFLTQRHCGMTGGLRRGGHITHVAHKLHKLAM